MVLDSVLVPPVFVMYCFQLKKSTCYSTISRGIGEPGTRQGGQHCDMRRPSCSCTCCALISMRVLQSSTLPRLHNPDGKPSVTGCHTHRRWISVGVGLLDVTRRAGKPDTGPYQLTSVRGVDASSLGLLADCLLVLLIWPGSSSQAELSSTSAWVSGSLGSPEGHWEGCDPTGPPAELPRGRGWECHSHRGE